ncbi:MAG: hypothetical protein EKK60_16495 [Gordonia sp. (in: high G+C Gram-positive bacteria)]|nr:MAG: hypothetical protein EKK60_16495 [Gordonia sp. (in: high G+C Gram-positive bacteria)]
MTTQPTPTQASVTANAESALSVLTSAVASLKQELEATMARKDELLAQRVKLYAAPLSPADIRQFIGELIDHRAAVYEQRLQDYQLADKIARPARDGTPTNQRSPLTLEDAEYALSHQLAVTRRSDPLRATGWELPIFLSYGGFGGWPYFFFGGIIKEKLTATLAEMQANAQPDTADTAAADEPTLDALRAEVVAISDEIAQLDSKAARLRGEIGRLTSPVLISAKRLQGATGAA